MEDSLGVQTSLSFQQNKNNHIFIFIDFFITGCLPFTLKTNNQFNYLL